MSEPDPETLNSGATGERSQFHRITGWIIGILVGCSFLLVASYQVGVFVRLNQLRAKGVEIRLDNRSGYTLTNLNVTCLGDDFKVESLPALAIATDVLKPYDDSGVFLSFEDQDQVVHELSVEAFISHRYSGYIAIEIQPDMSLKVENEAYHD